MWLDILWKDLLEFNTKFCCRIFCREQFVEISTLWILKLSATKYSAGEHSTFLKFSKFYCEQSTKGSALCFLKLSTTKYSANEHSTYLGFYYEIFCQWTFCISRILLRNILPMNILHFWGLLQNILPMNIMHFWGSSRKIFC